MDNLIAQLDQYFGKQAPQLPEGLKSLIVQFVPFLIILGAIAMIPMLLALVGLTGFLGMSGFYMLPGAYYAGPSFISIIGLVLMEILYVMAIPGLFSKSISGWNLMFYASLVSVASSILSFNIIGGAIGAVIGWYFLFQVRPYYTGAVSTPVPPSYNPPVPPPQA